MLPYFEQPVWHVGPLTIHAFGIAVAVAAWLGLTLGQRRFAQLGLEPVAGQRLGGWMLVGIALYFGYGRRNSKVAALTEQEYRELSARVADPETVKAELS